MENKISMNGSFDFDCVRCGKCCYQHVDLSPYDVFIISQHLNISARDFVDKNCDITIHTEMHTPFARLKTKLSGACVYLKVKDGAYMCSIEDIKPTACRLYPLGRGFDDSLSNQAYPFGGFFMLQNITCGSGQKKKQSVVDWVKMSDKQMDFDKTLAKFMERLMATPRAYFSDENIHLIFALMYDDYSDEEPFEEQFLYRASFICNVLIT